MGALCHDTLTKFGSEQAVIRVSRAAQAVGVITTAHRAPRSWEMAVGAVGMISVLAISSGQAPHAEGLLVRGFAMSRGGSGHGWRARKTRCALRGRSPRDSGLSTARLARTCSVTVRVGRVGECTERSARVAARRSGSSESRYLRRESVSAPVSYTASDTVVTNVVNV